MTQRESQYLFEEMIGKQIILLRFTAGKDTFCNRLCLP